MYIKNISLDKIYRYIYINVIKYSNYLYFISTYNIIISIYNIDICETSILAPTARKHE